MRTALPLPVLGSYFKFRDRSVLITSNPTQVLEPNPNRWAIIWFFTTGTSTAIPAGDTGVSGGFRTDLGQGVITQTFEQLGGVIQGAWSGAINPVGAVYGVYEILYLPPASGDYGPVVEYD